MISLFLDSASTYMVVGIYRDTEQLYLEIQENDRQLSEKLLPAIHKAFQSIDMSIAQIDRIYIVNGPGSFTGVRIGVTVAKTLAWTLHKEIIPISELELYASTETEVPFKLSLIDARRNFVYAGLYDADLNPIMTDCYISLEDLKSQVNHDTLAISTDTFSFKTEVPKFNIPLIIEKHKNDLPVNPHELNPNYLKRTEAEEKHDS